MSFKMPLEWRLRQWDMCMPRGLFGPILQASMRARMLRSWSVRRAWPMRLLWRLGWAKLRRAALPIWMLGQGAMRRAWIVPLRAWLGWLRLLDAVQ